MNNEKKPITQEEWEYIEDYLSESHPPMVMKEIERKIAEDASFADAVQEVKSTIYTVQEIVLSEKMNEWHQTVSTHDHVIPMRQNFTSKALIAASLLLLIALGTWWMIRPSHEEKLFAKYYHPDPGLPTLMSLSEQYEFDKAMVDYKSKDYDKALQSFQNLLIENPNNDTLNFFIAQIFLAQNQAEKAIPYFEKVISDSNSIFTKDAYWYLGLEMLRQQRKDIALKYIHQSEHERKQELLEAL